MEGEKGLGSRGRRGKAWPPIGCEVRNKVEEREKEDVRFQFGTLDGPRRKGL